MQSGEHRRRACIIHNPEAGRGRGRGLEERLGEAGRHVGWDVAVRPTQHAGHETELARAARQEGWPVVVASGGDGTVHGVVNGLLQDGPSDTVLGHVPVGSGNDYARVVGLRKAPVERNLALTLAGRERRLDVGRALGEYFVNSMGVGFGAEVVRQALGMRRLRAFALYLAAACRAFLRFSAPELTVESAERTECARMTMLEVGIGRTAGGGFRLMPEARPDDGLFDVCLIREVGVLQFIRYLPRVIRGTHGTLAPVSIFRTARLSVASASGPLAVHLDGELRLPATARAEIEILPAYLRVLCAP